MELSVYFGHHPEPRFHRLAQALFNVFPVPLLRASFLRRQKWRLQGLRPIPVGDIPAEQREILRGAIEQHFARPMPEPKAPAARFELAILATPADRSPPSDPPAIRRFEKAAEANGFEAEVIGPDDFGRLAEFDALFIRETTRVNHHTYRFAARARNEGLIVIDGPDSIVRCSNKIVSGLPGIIYRLPRTDGSWRLLANPQLRVTEGQTATARFGDQVPVPVTTFSAIATGGVAQQPITSSSTRTWA